MKKFVRESLYESPFVDNNDEDIDLPPEIENDEDVEVEDDWEKPEEDSIEDEVDAIDSSDMEADEIEVEDVASDDLKIALDAELDLKEFNRTLIEFRVIQRGGKRGSVGPEISGIVMGKMRDNEYIFKTSEGLKKYNIKDIVVLENQNIKFDNSLNEILKDGYEYEYVDYLFDIATFLMLHPENVQAIMNIHDVNDEEEAKVLITNELEDHDEIYGTKEMYDNGIEAEEAALMIVNQYQG